MSHRRHANDQERRKWQDPEAILAKILLKAGQTFVDIGCGGGFFALPAARLVGENGMVYGVDTDDISLNELGKLTSEEGLNNLNLTVGRAEDVIPCESCADIVFFGMALHDFAEPSKVLENAKKILKPAGRLINLDWKKESMKLGPPLQIRFSEKQAVELIEEAAYKILSVEDIGQYHYIIVASKYPTA